MKKLLNTIEAWWRYEGRFYHKDFTSGIKNLIRWFPVIWKDRDWDDHFIWELMIQKLKFQAKYIGERDFHTSAKRDAEIMMTCVRLMEKIKEEYYGTEYLDYQESHYEFIPFEDDSLYEMKSTLLDETFDEYLKKYQSTVRKVNNNPKSFNYISEEYRDSKGTLAMLVAKENHSKAKRILFTLMEHNIECWWD